ncbi:MAG TPA: ATP-binding protein [Terriglobales bacterium]|nr:ATP-binding protein [Terriglobales bacterium]
MKNPFEFGRELGVDEIVDREAEISEVVATIENAGKLFLIGPRRYGKTSVLKAAQDRLGAAGAVVLRHDAESYPSLDLLVNALVVDAARQLKGSVERIGDQIRQFFSSLRPELNFSVTERVWTAKVGVIVSDVRDRQITLLLQALDGLEELAKAQPKHRPVGLVIDEFQKIIELGGKTAESNIRAAIQRHRRVGYVFAGSKTKLLATMITDAARPFYRLGTSRFIAAVPRQDFIRFLRKKFVEGRFRIGDPGVLDLILNLSEEVPYNVQMLAHACWENLRAQAKSEAAILNEDLVQHSIEQLVRQYDPFYTQVWNGLTAIQQKTLILALNEGGANLQSIKAIRAIGKGASTVRKSLIALMDRGILREEESSGGVRMRFEDPFFAKWIGMFAPRI